MEDNKNGLKKCNIMACKESLQVLTGFQYFLHIPKALDPDDDVMRVRQRRKAPSRNLNATTTRHEEWKTTKMVLKKCNIMASKESLQVLTGFQYFLHIRKAVDPDDDVMRVRQRRKAPSRNLNVIRKLGEEASGN